MSIAAALIFMAEASAACAPAAPARLAGGAQVVRTILEFEEEAPQPPALTRASGRAQRSTPLGAADANKPAAAAARCNAGPPPIA